MSPSVYVYCVYDTQIKCDLMLTIMNYIESNCGWDILKHLAELSYKNNNVKSVVSVAAKMLRWLRGLHFTVANFSLCPAVKE